MRHPAIPALLFAFWVAPLTAQPVETVTVRDAALTGLWKIAVPEGLGTNFVHTHFGPMKNIFCRITQTGTAFTINCLNGGFSRSGTGTIEGNKVHIAWGVMMARMVIDGEHAGNSIDGHFTFKLSGISHEDAYPSHSERLTPPVADPDGGKSVMLKAILEEKPVPHDDVAIAKNDGALPAPNKLGAIQVIAYLGTSPKLDDPHGADFYSVYDVEFANGDRICGLHQRDNGVLDAFRCV